jgi:hypothetical protein
VIGRVLPFFKNLKLSLAEWLSVSAVVIIGGLVAALKLQGSQLHSAQVKLAGAARDARAAQDDKDSTAADQRYQTLRAEYLKAGGKI